MWRAALLAVVLVGSASAQEADPSSAVDIAKQRLADRQAKREADRAQVVTITRGELEDLRSEVASLRAQLAQLQSQSPTDAKPASTHAPLKLEVGMTKSQVTAFLNAHKQNATVTADDSALGGEDMTISLLSPDWEAAGSHSNGVNNIKDFRKTFVETGKLTIALREGVISEVSQTGEWSTKAPPLPTADQGESSAVRHKSR